MHKLMTRLVTVAKVVILLSFIAMLIVGGIAWAKYNNTFVNPNFMFSGNSIVDDSEYQMYLAQINSTNLLEDDYSDLASIIESHPYVAGVRISKHFPENILVEISERYPVALINTSPLLLVDNISTILPFRSNSLDLEIPIISNFDIEHKSLILGKQTEATNVVEAVDFLNRLKIEYPSLYDNLSEFRTNDYNDYELILEDEPTTIVIGNSIAWSKIVVLQEFEKNINGHRNLSDYVYLDLRYNNQVITKERRV